MFSKVKYALVILILTFLKHSDSYGGCEYCLNKWSTRIAEDTFKNYNKSTCFSITKHSYECKVNVVHKDSFKNMGNVTEIWLSGNIIESLDNTTFQDTLKLVQLTLSFNEINQLQNGLFSNLNNLKNLLLNYNRIELIGNTVFSDLISLEDLDLASNMITELDKNIFKFNHNLKYLSLAKNRIQNLSAEFFQNKPNLENLILNTNQIKKLVPNLFSNLTNLKSLDLSQNQLESIDNFVFAGLKSLANLYLQNNLITSIDPKAFPVPSEIFTINLSQNKLINLSPKLFENMTSLHQVNLNNNPWVCNCKLSEIVTYVKQMSWKTPSCNSPAKLQSTSWSLLNDTNLSCNIEIYGEEILKIGENVTFSCKIDGFNITELMWYYNNTLINNTSPFNAVTKKQISNDLILYNLTIHQLSANNSGTYTCKAKNDYDIVRKQFNFTYEYNEITIISNYININAQTAVLSCIFTPNENTKIAWLRNNTLITKENRSASGIFYEFTNEKLTKDTYIMKMKIHQPTYNDSDTYSCAAKAPSQFVEKKFDVFLIEIITNNIHFEEDFIKIRCEIKCSKAVQLKWFFNSQPIDINSTRSNGNSYDITSDNKNKFELKIQDATDEDSGMYSCRASSDFHVKESFIDLSINLPRSYLKIILITLIIINVCIIGILIVYFYKRRMNMSFIPKGTELENHGLLNLTNKI